MMRIDGPKNVKSTSASRSKKSKKTSRTFSLKNNVETEAASASQGASSVSSVGSIDALIALQGVEGRSPEKRQRAVQHGFALLDDLEGLRVEVLSGRLSMERLKRLRHVLQQRQTSDDPSLEALIDDIDLRVRVEIAKLGY